MGEERKFEKVLVTGGAGYVGSVLVPRLLDEGYATRVLDSYIYGKESLAGVRGHSRLDEVEGDIRDEDCVRRSLEGCDAVIHLACIANDPSVELDEALSRTINYEAFISLVKLSRDARVSRFVFASSGSVYGVTEDPDVTEEHELVPVSLYNKYKAMCEPVLLDAQSEAFTTITVRPATICGCSPRQRLDLTVNILTNHAVNANKITVFGGEQMRPNLHMQDMIDLYVQLLEEPERKVAGEVFNAAYENFSVMETAEKVKKVVEKESEGVRDVPIVTTASDDIRSYYLSSEKARRVLEFVPKRDIETAVGDLIRAFGRGDLPNSMDDPRYFNVRRMKEMGLK